MRTTTVRLDEDQMMLLESIAKHDGCSTSDVLRRAVASFINEKVDTDSEFAAEVVSVLRRRLAESIAGVQAVFGRISNLPALIDDLPDRLEPANNGKQ